MFRILVVGDYIEDRYSFCKATRLCPEAPVPVLIVDRSQSHERVGGAANVAVNIGRILEALFEFSSDTSRLGVGDPTASFGVTEGYGSYSRKRRIYADHALVCRIDEDSIETGVMARQCNTQTLEDLLRQLPRGRFQTIVVSDYDKGAMSPTNIQLVMDYAKKNKIPVFVDAKKDLTRYKGAFAVFPNATENLDVKAKSKAFTHVVRKLGAKGCVVDGIVVNTKPQLAFDVTGAGDVFMAAFVAKYAMISASADRSSDDLLECARFANAAAGLSVQVLGTTTVSRENIEKALGEK